MASARHISWQWHIVESWAIGTEGEEHTYLGVWQHFCFGCFKASAAFAFAFALGVLPRLPPINHVILFFIFLCCYCCLQLLRPKIKANWPPPLYFFILSLFISSAHPIVKSRLFYDPFILHYHWDTWLQSIGFYFYLNFRGRTQIGPLGERH